MTDAALILFMMLICWKQLLKILSIEVYKFYKTNLLPIEEELNVKICIFHSHETVI